MEQERRDGRLPCGGEHDKVLTGVEDLLSLGVRGAEGAVQLELACVVQEGASNREENVLSDTKKEH